MRRRIAVIGGTGASRIVPPSARAQVAGATRWGEPSGNLLVWQSAGMEVWFLPRHGSPPVIAPHRVNYRANIECLRALDPEMIVGLNAVGGITPATWPGRLVLPAQLIDYTWGREHTFGDSADETVRHVDFDPPFDEGLRKALARAAHAAGADVLVGGTYGVTQGPRLETAAEIDRLAADGCDVVGMTAMPEASLAREAGLKYAICAMVVNRAAGRLPEGASIHGDMQRFLDAGLEQAARTLGFLFASV